jgi:hypothetical protein
MSGILDVGSSPPTYTEVQTKGGHVIMQSEASCAIDHYVTPTPAYIPPVAVPPVAVAPTRDSTNYAPAPAPVYTPAPTPTYVAPPADSTPRRFTVALYDIPHIIDGLYVNVNIGGTNYHMTLDTGCSDLFISKAVADWLISSGQAVATGERHGKQADGTVSTSRSLSIKSISLDGHVITDVPASDGAPDQEEGTMLLGLGVLKKFGKFSIDAVGHQLVLG